MRKTRLAARVGVAYSDR